MTTSHDNRATSPVAAGGLIFLLITSVGWGLNWPIMKFVLREWPPLSARGATGVVGSLLLLAIALAVGQSLRVPREQWPRLVMFALFNVSAWMALMGLALLWLPAGEAATIAYVMPVLASLLAWPVLGERLTPLRALSLLLGIGGVGALMGGDGLAASMEKLPGIVLALTGAFLFALGTVLGKRYPLRLPVVTSAAWQIMIGCLPVALIGLVVEQPKLSALTPTGWALMGYLVLVQFCVAYVSWFAALRRLPASVAAIGTLLVPVIGVLASAAVLGEPLGMGQLTALAMTIAGVVLATRS
ncbi:DMT family transporter [Bradyrhizobium sp. U87765 SZCCT0131]|uniref:DMT family transporter n=1 Tax=unclassified Bradyrhizobium TaxID=2631580 RepID=UPI001BA45FB4|nr:MULTISPECIES: DMT family transporter [unclassified Bradyrhizobium]MBR1220381.1 DMT family transporter [Bradyrhizobium sp. U87765 SZCCT0131]MBR1263164.1 DMT family transporter [Bradyrhizobium sp. U87765 SZCCT0134]MBR1306953.1 DMT family transporter [Bradyrhizobium sp. U87765 SZCCT0110]MBR1323452.1 DMT family transporter [Bradyrhizobium sp. U87765 SZCCT0109]MBR1345907.1 DMT family transporter [Bradyrhizobium sp. U87765 SZCCT0048]